MKGNVLMCMRRTLTMKGDEQKDSEAGIYHTEL